MKVPTVIAACDAALLRKAKPERGSEMGLIPQISTGRYERSRNSARSLPRIRIAVGSLPKLSSRSLQLVTVPGLRQSQEVYRHPNADPTVRNGNRIPVAPEPIFGKCFRLDFGDFYFQFGNA